MNGKGARVSDAFPGKSVKIGGRGILITVAAKMGTNILAAKPENVRPISSVSQRA